jgi:hypothetical protein
VAQHRPLVDNGAPMADLARRTRRLPLRSLAALLLLLCAAFIVSGGLGAASARADDTTASMDNLRTGWDPDEPGLSPASVQASDFGQLFSATVDGAVYGQPLVVGDDVIVTTENASVYAFDKISGALRWQRHFGAPFQAASIGCGDLTPDLGSTSTPVYDPDTGDIYLTTKLADGADAQHPHWYMQAISAATGQDASGFPVTIAGTPQNTPGLPFDPFYEMQRPGLLLLDGVVYAAFGAHCDIEPYRGYVVGVSTTTHSMTTMWSDESGSGADAQSQAGIWQSGGGLVSDGAGRIFLTTGNGISPPPGDGDSPPGTLAESVVRLQVQPDGSLAPTSFFAPANAPTLDQFDTDLGSGGPVALPDADFGTASHPHLLVQVGKDGRIFLLDRDHLGGRKQGPQGTDDALAVVGPFNGVWGHPAVYGGEGGYVYTVENQGNLRALAYGVNAGGGPTLTSTGTSTGTFGYTSGSPVVTSDGTTPGSAIVWVEYSTGPEGTGAQLRAYRAIPSGGVLQQIYSAPIGVASKFAVPATDDGRVYVGTRDGHLLGFGRPAAPALSTPSLQFKRVPVGGSRTLVETVTASRDVTVQSITTGGPFAASPPALPTLLHAGDTLRVPVRFAPTTPGGVTSTLTFDTDAGTLGADLDGYGTRKGLLATPGSLDFGQVAVGNGAENLSVNISNSGRKPLTITGATLPGAPFRATQVPAAGTIVQPQQTVTVSVSYDPPAAETDSDALTIDSSAGSVTVPLTGSAVKGHSHLTLTPTSTDFGGVLVGTSRTVTFDISNTGNIPLTITKAKAPAGVFSTDTPVSEGLTLAPGAVVHQRVTFTPTAVGPASADYLISSDDGRGAQQEILTGTGVTTLPSASTWQLNGSAAADGAHLRLTDTGQSEAGSAIYPEPVGTDGLTATYTVRMGGGTGADGMTFVLLNPSDSSPTSLGSSGGGLGFSGLDGVAVALDTYQNGNDPSSNFVGIASGVQGDDIAWTETDTLAKPLRGRDVRVSLTIAGGKLTVSCGGQTLPAVDVSGVLGPTAYVGFTGATGGSTDKHVVRRSKITPGS